jgi:hypothetical protein
MKEEEAPVFTYLKSWEEGRDDLWLVFHKSGTTGLSSNHTQPTY